LLVNGRQVARSLVFSPLYSYHSFLGGITHVQTPSLELLACFHSPFRPDIDADLDEPRCKVGELLKPDHIFVRTTFHLRVQPALSFFFFLQEIGAARKSKEESAHEIYSSRIVQLQNLYSSRVLGALSEERKQALIKKSSGDGPHVSRRLKGRFGVDIGDPPFAHCMGFRIEMRTYWAP